MLASLVSKRISSASCSAPALHIRPLTSLEHSLSTYQYLIAITVTYVPYIASELPVRRLRPPCVAPLTPRFFQSNLLLKAVGPHIMIPSMVFLWGITCCESDQRCFVVGCR